MFPFIVVGVDVTANNVSFIVVGVDVTANNVSFYCCWCRCNCQQCRKEGSATVGLCHALAELQNNNNNKYWLICEGCLNVHLPHEIKWYTNLMQLGNFIDVFLARHVSGTHAHHQEHWMLSCSIWFSAPSFWMGVGWSWWAAAWVVCAVRMVPCDWVARLLMMGVCTRNMSSLEYTNKITLLHQVGISLYFINSMCVCAYVLTSLIVRANLVFSAPSLVACLAPLYFATLSHKPYNFREKNIKLYVVFLYNFYLKCISFSTEFSEKLS